MTRQGLGIAGKGVAVLVPCYNEAATIAQVVSGFRKSLPEAEIYVYDNGSTDDTMAQARAAGAIVRSEQLRGKGNVVRRMFADVDAEAYVMVDGDLTYDPTSAPQMVERLAQYQLDMVTGVRVAQATEAYRTGHRFGNRLLTGLVRALFGAQTSDMLSGYRVFSRRFVKSFPALSSGFEIETELTIHALALKMPSGEVETPYSERLAGSESKLRTYRDGTKILRVILRLTKEERPRAFFGTLGTAFALMALVLAFPLFPEYLRTGLVPRFPTAVLSSGMMMVAFVLYTCGVILESVTLGRREARRLAYLRFAPPQSPSAERWVRSTVSQGDARPEAVATTVS